MSEPTRLGPALDAWRMTRWPKSYWRVRARKRMQDVIEELSIMQPPIVEPSEVLRHVDAEYPFGERKYEPYKCWLKERRILIAALWPATMPAADEAGACEVAGDLVELGRIDEARRLLEDRAPNRLNLACPVCGMTAKRPCSGLGTGLALLVPHLSRVGLHGRDVSPGPLFEGVNK